MKNLKVISVILALILTVCLCACASAEGSRAYLNVIQTVNNETGAGYTIPISTNNLLIDQGDGTYILYINNTIDISAASGGYLSAVGGGKVLYGTCELTEEDGEDVYKLSKPTRVIMSSFMMTGPDATINIYVDSDDVATYANYSVADITALDAEAVVDILLKTNVMGAVSEDDAQWYSTAVVNLSKFTLEDLY